MPKAFFDLLGICCKLKKKDNNLTSFIKKNLFVNFLVWSRHVRDQTQKGQHNNMTYGLKDYNI